MKFILTNEVGRLARWLRIFGFDTVYHKTNNIGTLIIIALREDRFIITRRKSKIDDLDKKTLILKSEKINDQIKEVFNNLKIKLDTEKMFSRCTICNEPLKGAKKEDLAELVPPYVYKTQDNFSFCNICKKVYWQGSHWGNVSDTLKRIGVL